MTAMNPLNRLSIRLRLGLLAGLALCLFALAGAYTVRASIGALERVHGERVVETAGIILGQVGSTIGAHMEQLARAGQLDPVRRALAAAGDGPLRSGAAGRTALRQAASEALRDAFILTDRRRLGRTVFQSITIHTPSGELVAGVDAQGGLDPERHPDTGADGAEWRRRAEQTGRAVIGLRGHVGDAVESAGLVVATRLDDAKGRMIGLARARVSAAWIAREAATATQLSRAFDILLTTSDGRLIYSRRPFRFLESVADRPLFRSMREPRGFTVLADDGGHRLVAHATNPAAPVIGALGWDLFISVDRDLVLADTLRLQRTLMVVFSALLVAATVVTVLLALSLVRPLNDLGAAARAVAGGDLSVRVRPRGRDELAALGRAFNTMAVRIQSNNEELRALAVTDPLTSVLNRRGFMQRAAVEVARCRRNGRPLSVLALDIDHFKAVNDTYGHDSGDAVLRQVAARLVGGLRPSDVVGRLGGEEFAIILPETPADAAVTLAERLRAEIAATPCQGPGSPIPVTASLGVACVDEAPPAGERAFEALLKQADEALYAAKANGRNRVERAGGAASDG